MSIDHGAAQLLALLGAAPRLAAALFKAVLARLFAGHLAALHLFPQLLALFRSHSPFGCRHGPLQFALHPVLGSALAPGPGLGERREGNQKKQEGGESFHGLCIVRGPHRPGGRWWRSL